MRINIGRMFVKRTDITKVPVGEAEFLSKLLTSKSPEHWVEARGDKVYLCENIFGNKRKVKL